MDDDDELEPWEDDGADLPDDGGAGDLVIEDDPEMDAPAPEAAPRSSEGPGERSVAVAEVPPAPLALYRRYRPDTFAGVIGQEHVTGPLQRALQHNRANHAYLFSGPRGCGKTTSARILARALNCENGPAAEPCGHCTSCRELATGGPGSIDVIEIDAASHGGVDDARDLREKAYFAPVNSRYKIYIIDEAHMVTTQGFNALLKLVEEPPPHVKFIFATTEPDKVIGTIRSRTHHYPFRLVPPKVLGQYLATICAEEGIVTEAGVLPLVVRAGGGSVRDSLSVLDQLLGGASEQGVTYEHATGLLGYTPEHLLDDMMSAFAAGDGAGVFSVVEKVIEAGKDPRRFAEDLLQRLRDLVVVAAVPDALSTGLVDVTPGQAEAYAAQATEMGLGELTRAADVIAEGLTQMRGTTSPRLHLELMCARVLLPGADVAERGTHARLDRIERRLNLGGLDTGVPFAEVPVGPAAGPDLPAAQGQRPRGTSPGSAPAQGRPVRPPRPDRPRPAPQAQPAPQTQPGPQAPAASPAPQVQSAPQARPAPQAPAEPRAGQRAPRPERPDVGGLTTQVALDRWDELMAAVGRRRMFTKVLLEGNAAVVSLVGGVLTLAFNSPGARASFERPRERGGFMEALTEVFGVVLQVDTIVDPDAGRHGRGGRGAGPSGPGGPHHPADAPPSRSAGAPQQPPAGAGPQAGSARGPAAPPASRVAPQTAAPTPGVATPPAAPPAAAPRDQSPEPPRRRGTRRGEPVPPPAHDDMPPPPEPPEDPWDEPPPEEDPYVPRQVQQPAGPPAPAMASPAPPSRPSRYSQVTAAPPPPKDLPPEEEAAAYSDEDDTVGEGYESAAELLTNVLGAELLLEEQKDTGLTA